MSPHTVILYPVNSQLRYLVIITLDSISSKKDSQIRYSLVFCLHRTIVPPRGHHHNQSLLAFPIEHKFSPYGVFFVDIISMTHSDSPIMATKRSADSAGVERAKRKSSSLTLDVKLYILKRKE